MIFDHTRSHFRCILNEMQLCSALTFNAWQVPCDVKRPGIEDESMIVQRLIDKMQQITCSAFFIRGKADERTKRKKKLVGRFLIDFDAVLIPNRLRSPGLYAFYPHLYLLPQKFQPHQQQQRPTWQIRMNQNLANHSNPTMTWFIQQTSKNLHCKAISFHAAAPPHKDEQTMIGAHILGTAIWFT